MFITYIIPITIILFGGFVVKTKNPIYALISLILVVFNFILLLLSQKIFFLSFVLLIVYIGAISILFLFIIMMFNLQDLVHNYVRQFKNYKYWISLIILWQPTLQLYYIFTNKINHYLFINYSKMLKYQYSPELEIETLNQYFYSLNGFYFLLCGCILLIAMLGAIILALI